jgi:hypothetical protein
MKLLQKLFQSLTRHLGSLIIGLSMPQQSAPVGG